MSLRSHAGVAQLAEQLICNQQVAGSSPIAGSSFMNFCVEGFPSGQREQTVNLSSYDFGCSNPPPSTIERAQNSRTRLGDEFRRISRLRKRVPLSKKPY